MPFSHSLQHYDLYMLAGSALSHSPVDNYHFNSMYNYYVRRQYVTKDIRITYSRGASKASPPACIIKKIIIFHLLQEVSGNNMTARHKMLHLVIEQKKLKIGMHAASSYLNSILYAKIRKAWSIL